jgi:hypothetical protein
MTQGEVTTAAWHRHHNGLCCLLHHMCPRLPELTETCMRAHASPHESTHLADEGESGRVGHSQRVQRDLESLGVLGCHTKVHGVGSAALIEDVRLQV